MLAVLARGSRLAARGAFEIGFMSGSVTWMQGAPYGASRATNFLRKRLAIGPHRPIFKVFFLPDWDSLLERIDNPSAGVKSHAAVGWSDHDAHAGFFDLQPAKAVDDRHSPLSEASSRLRRQSF